MPFLLKTSTTMYVFADCLDLSHGTDFTFCFQRVADFIMEAVADSPQLKAMVVRFINEMNENLDSAERIHKPAKRNSELLNSLLGKHTPIPHYINLKDFNEKNCLWQLRLYPFLGSCSNAFSTIFHLILLFCSSRASKKYFEKWQVKKIHFRTINVQAM